MELPNGTAKKERNCGAMFAEMTCLWIPAFYRKERLIKKQNRAGSWVRYRSNV